MAHDGLGLALQDVESRGDVKGLQAPLPGVQRSLAHRNPGVRRQALPVFLPIEAREVERFSVGLRTRRGGTGAGTVAGYVRPRTPVGDVT